MPKWFWHWYWHTSDNPKKPIQNYMATLAAARAPGLTQPFHMPSPSHSVSGGMASVGQSWPPGGHFGRPPLHGWVQRRLYDDLDSYILITGWEGDGGIQPTNELSSQQCQQCQQQWWEIFLNNLWPTAPICRGTWPYRGTWPCRGSANPVSKLPLTGKQQSMLSLPWIWKTEDGKSQISH